MPLNIDWQQILLHLFNFFILAIILYFLLYKPVKKFMAKREDYYKKMDDDAQKNLQEAQEFKQQYDAKLNDLKKEIGDKKKQAFNEIEEYRQSQVKQAQLQADKIIEEAKINANNEKQKIVEQASKEISQIVTEATQKIVLENSASQAFDQFLDLAERGDDDAKQ